MLTFFKRVRPTGLLKRKKTDTSTHLESQDGENGLLAQLVELLLAKQKVASSNLVSRSNWSGSSVG